MVERKRSHVSLALSSQPTEAETTTVKNKESPLIDNGKSEESLTLRFPTSFPHQCH